MVEIVLFYESLEVGLFFMPFFRQDNTKNKNGGGSCAHKDYISLHRVSAS